MTSLNNLPVFRVLLLLVSVLKFTQSTSWDGITPWFSGSKCNCNGYSNRCMFDAKLYEQSGHGGHCLDCTANRDGPNCERCKLNYYMREDGYCTACDCDEVGSRNLQCNDKGQCQCKSGVSGDKCNRCTPNHYDLTVFGCTSCHCNDSGSINNEAACDEKTGNCFCKDNVEGKLCSDCKPGFFNLDPENSFGCTPCFCYGHSSQCTSAHGYFRFQIESTFTKSSERWTAQDINGQAAKLKFETISQSIGVQANDKEFIFFIAPDRFLGDQRYSYNQFLEFFLRTGDSRPIASAADIILEGGDGNTISNTIYAQNNKLPTIETQNYRFRLHEHPDFGWSPKQTSLSFISLLSNLTALKIRGTYSLEGVGFLDNVKLETASRGVAGKAATWVETCECPQGYVGQYCESCAPGYRHYPGFGGPFTNCIPCDCNGHANICDLETGRCICQHNTTGESCDFCARGFYGNALAGTPNDCLPCNCPNEGSCIQIDEHTITCTECPAGYTGHKCDTCSDGYYGDPVGLLGPPKPCRACDCNENVDPNAIGNCDTATGDCLKCIYFTDGKHCDQCLPGYYGDALVLPKGGCKKCQCHEPGTEDHHGRSTCDETTGACKCKPNVIGNNCDQCVPGYFNIDSEEGCHACNCDPIGSFNQSCDLYTGQCFCRSGVIGLRCDHCETRKYGFSFKGCTDCNCDKLGSKDLQCDGNGQCPCLDNVEGTNCDRCKENKYNIEKGCTNCPECYNLIQNAAKNCTNKLEELTNVLNDVENQPTIINDDDFFNGLSQLKKDINHSHNGLTNFTNINGLFNQLKNIEHEENILAEILSEIDEMLFQANEKQNLAEINFDHANQISVEIKYALEKTEENLERKGKRALEDALARAKTLVQQSEKMTEIAQEAKELADYLDENHNILVNHAKGTKNKSITAHNQAKNVSAAQQFASGKISDFQNNILDAEIMLTKTQDWVRQLSTETKQVMDDTLALMIEISNEEVLTIDVILLNSTLKQLKNTAYDLGNKTKEMIRKNKEVRDSTEERIIIAKELLERSKDEQTELNDLHNDISLFDAQATQAINLWNNILGTAEANYKILADFDHETQKRREHTEEALKHISDIEKIIKETQVNINDAQNNIEDSKDISQIAFEKAVQANQLAKNASIKATKIKSDGDNLFQNTSFLSDEANLMYDRAINTEGELKNLLEKAKSNNSLVHEAKEKVGRAAKDTNTAFKGVNSLVSDIEDVIYELQNTPDITDDDIDRLEKELRILEDRLQETKLEEKLEQLQKKYKSQNDLIEQYKDQIKILEKEVLNVEEILNALPTDCYTHYQLEP